MKSFSLSRIILVLALMSSHALGAENSLRIGILLNLSSPMGKEARNAIDMAMHELKFSRGAPELVFEDTGGKPDIASSRARELVDQRGVTLVVGTESSSVQSSVLKVLREKRVTLISLSAEPVIDESKNVSIFRIGPNHGHIAVALEGLLKYLRKSELHVVGAEARMRTAIVQRTLSPDIATHIELTEISSLNSLKSEKAAIFVPNLLGAPPPLDIVPDVRKVTGAPIIFESGIGIGGFAGVSATQGNSSDEYVVTLYSRASDEGKRFYDRYLNKYHTSPFYEFGSRAYAAMQMVEYTVSHLTPNQQKGAKAISEVLRGREFNTILGKLDFRGGSECARLPLAAIRLDKARTVVFSTQGGACKCGDEACCKNCCNSKRKACSSTTSCDD